MAFEFHFRQEDPFLILSLKGRLLAEEDAKEIVTQLNTYDFSKTIHLVVDATELSLCNSSGINSLVKMMTKTRVSGGDLYLFNPSESLMKVFEITRVNQIFTILHLPAELEELKRQIQQ